ncbi:MAG: potassium transporter Kup [Verrucomicrobia subdivision 3 bacterium]|nr:potassium transporter Kup [Limisphaerales bacterium]
MQTENGAGRESEPSSGPRDAPSNAAHSSPLVFLTLGALGVVYGDIGTSPLYALRSCFSSVGGVEATHDNVLGLLSLIFWSLILIVSIKYLAFVMRADNRGEGGILALMALAFPERDKAVGGRGIWLLVSLGVFGAALLYGDGLITPAISVLGAIEGLEVATPVLKPYVVPLTILVLGGLFSVQRIGTGRVGSMFGWVMLLWFFTLAALGINQIIRVPQVLAAVNPVYAINFFSANGLAGFHQLGAVFLVLTGAEALYADMGHFGRKPIRCAWFGLVLPALFLNYLGQGALVLQDPEAAVNPFYRLAPAWALYPLIALATTAAVIASQALISGSFSLTMQAVQLGFAPRVAIEHTSSSARGQIYIPWINWGLMFACIGLVLGFRSSDNLAAAYGIAVVLTMIITTLLLFFAARRLWGWSGLKAGAICAVFLAADLCFLGANLTKIRHGGWFPLVVGVLGFTLMSTWKTGRQRLRQRLINSLLPIEDFLKDVETTQPPRVPGTAIFLAGNPDGTPAALTHNFKHNKIIHKRVVLLTILTEEIPFVESERRVSVADLGQGFHRVIGRYGFMEEPNAEEILKLCKPHGLNFREMETTFFLSRETIIASDRRGLARWRKHLFALLARNAQPANAYFRLPPNRVVELGLQVEI